jgi:hypothetical protein
MQQHDIARFLELLFSLCDFCNSSFLCATPAHRLAGPKCHTHIIVVIYDQIDVHQSLIRSKIAKSFLQNNPKSADLRLRTRVIVVSTL